MRNILRFLSKYSPAVLLGWCLVSMPAAAEVTADAAPVPLKSMTQAEYAAYREQLQKQVKEVAVNVPEQGEATEETEAKKDKSEDSGYGRGYRSRTERGGRTGSGYRGGSMSRGGGRGR
jgi:hypothetical protein